MRIQLLSDFHLRTSDNLGKIILSDGLNSRLTDRLKNIKISVEKAISDEVECVIIAGDIFEKLNPPELLKKLFIKSIAPLIINGIQTYILMGNHDTDLDTHNLMGEKELIESIVGDLAGRVHIISTPTTIKNLEDEFPILLLPWIGRNKMIEVVKNLKEPHIIITHLETPGAKLCNYQIKLDEVDPEDFKDHFIFSGHIHKHQLVRQNWVYIGSIIRMDYAEATDRKGYILCNNKKDNLSWQFIELPDKQLLTIEVIPEYNQYNFLDKLDDFKDQSIIKVIFKGPEDWYAGLDKKRVLTILYEKNAHKIFTSFENTEIKSLRNPEVTVDSRLEEAIGIYCQKKSREDLAELGLKILKDVESMPI